MVPVPLVLLLQTLTGVVLLLALQWLLRRPDLITRWLALTLAGLIVLAAPLTAKQPGRTVIATLGVKLHAIIHQARRRGRFA